MNVKERILAIRLLEKQKKNPELAKQLGIDIKMVAISEEEKVDRSLLKNEHICGF